MASSTALVSSAEAKRKMSTICWDPKNPCLLAINPQISGENKNELILKQISSDVGVGCNDHELNALEKVVDFHDEYFDDFKKAADADLAVQLSQYYRGAVQECLSKWHEQRHQEEDTQQGVDENLKTLESMYTVMHLADVFLPLFISRVDWNNSTSDHGDQFNVPGIATANMIRFLRYNLLPAEDDLSDPEIRDMLESSYPEQCGDGAIFWEYLTGLVLRGCLEKAWTVLAKHSAYTEAVMALEQGEFIDPYVSGSLAFIRDGFHTLNDIFMRAPLPAGRTDEFDDALGEIPWSDDVEDPGYSESVDVEPSDYKHWESFASGDNMTFNIGLEHPAFRKYKDWREYAKNKLQHFPLAQRIPGLKPLLAVLCGDLSQVEFTSWPERLIAELLYVSPDMRPRNLSARARRIVESDFPAQMDDDLVFAILNIMDGNMGEALTLMYSFGGASGAALPSTLTALLFSLFYEFSVLSEDMASRKGDFLCDAASAIVSSLAEENLGTLIAVKLLVPYAITEGNREIAAYTALLLEHYVPNNDSGAETIMEMCKPLVAMKSAPVLDGCASLALCRYRAHMAYGRIQDAISWLLRGIKMEESLLPLIDLGSCYRTLAAECVVTTDLLLDRLISSVGSNRNSSELDIIAKNGKAFLTELDGAPGKSRSIPQVSALRSSIALYDAVMRDENSADRRASTIITCLETTNVLEIENEPASAALKRRMLQVIHRMLLLHSDADILDPTKDNGDFGIVTLMEHLLEMEVDAASQKTHSPTEEELRDMRELLLKAQARAFIKENAIKSKPKDDVWRKTYNARTSDLDKLTFAEQEILVQHLLDN